MQLYELYSPCKISTLLGSPTTKFYRSKLYEFYKLQHFYILAYFREKIKLREFAYGVNQKRLADKASLFCIQI